MSTRILAAGCVLAFFSQPLLAQENGETGIAPRLLWSLDTHAPCYGSPAVADLDGDGKLEIAFGTYYNDEHLYCVNAEDGTVLWKMKSEGGPFDASCLPLDVDGDGRLEIIAGDSSTGTLFALEGATGKVVWKFAGPNSTDSPPAAADLDGDGKPEIVYGTMAEADRRGTVVALNAEDASLVWLARVPGHVQSEPCLVDLEGDGQIDVLVTTWMGDHRIRALSGKDGHELWTHETGDSMYHGVSAGDLDGDGKPEIVASSTDGSACCLSGAGGKLLWKKKLGDPPICYLFGPVTLADLAGDAHLEVLVPGRDLYCLNAAGELLWTHEIGQQIPRGAAVADLDGDGDLEVALGADDRVFRVVSGAEGKELARFDARIGEHEYEGIDSAPLLADLDGDGCLDAFFVGGKGTSDETRAANCGRAHALSLGKGRGPGWLMLGHDSRRSGSATGPFEWPRR
ncbi:MAG: VCBS repeat-containing protein [Planctomycetes bacterium]|nr:VCBS repeat-containing protein [Planctomycetota bacterium]